jgi:hypothetical protein
VSGWDWVFSSNLSEEQERKMGLRREINISIDARLYLYFHIRFMTYLLIFRPGIEIRAACFIFLFPCVRIWICAHFLFFNKYTRGRKK